MSAFEDARELDDVDVAANIAMQHRDAIASSASAVGTFAYENRQQGVEFVGRHGAGFQRQIDWDAPHDNIPPQQQQQQHQASQGSHSSPAELQERWQRALREEARLQQLAERVDAKERHASGVVRRMTPNFPRPFLCVGSVVHHDIQADIIVSRQPFVKLVYGNWWATIVMLAVNFIINLIIMLLPMKSGSDGTSNGGAKTTSQHVGLAAAYLVGIPLSFMTWYWQVYKACAFHSSVTYVAAFIGLLIALAFAVFMAIGIVGLGGTGAVFAAYVADVKGTGASIPVGIMCALWCLQSILFVYIIFRLRQFYKEDGASIEEAKQQVATGAAKAYAKQQI